MQEVAGSTPVSPTILLPFEEWCPANEGIVPLPCNVRTQGNIWQDAISTTGQHGDCSFRALYGHDDFRVTEH